MVLVCGSQMGKTEGLLVNLIGATVHMYRKPVTFVAPTRPLAESVSKARFSQMLKLTPVLMDGLENKRHHTLHETYLYGARIGFAWAGSPTELSSREAMIVLVDERDRMKILSTDGDPLHLSKARTATYANSCVVVPSTPTLGDIKTVWCPDTKLERWAVTDPADVRSPVWKAWQAGSRHEWATPCPRCGAGFILRRSLLKYDDRAPLEEIEQMAHVQCPRCKKRIEPSERRKLAQSGAYVAPKQSLVDGEVKGPEPANRTRSRWVSGLHSPWMSWGRRAHDYEEARREGEAGNEQGVVNVDFGECFTMHGERPTEAEIHARKGNYSRGQVPDWVSILVAAIDISAHGLWWLVRGFGPLNRSALIDYGMTQGATRDPEGTPDVWEETDDYLSRPIEGLPVRRVGVDSGYAQNACYYWCRTHRGLYFPIRGSKKLTRNYLSSPIDFYPNSKKPLPNSVELVTFGVNRVKQQIRQKIDPRGAKMGSPGSWEIPQDIDDEYIAHMRAEEEVDLGGGEVKFVRHGENHWWDCEVYTFTTIEWLKKGRPVKSREEEAAGVRRRKRGPRR